MIAAIGTVVRRGCAIYCSTPINTGPLYFQWLDRLGTDYENIDLTSHWHHAAHRTEVVAPNARRANEVCEWLRVHTGKVVINPAVLELAVSWSQDEWRMFWGRVIAVFSEYVVFVDGWEFSNGCVYEFMIAAEKGIPTFDERLVELSISNGRDRIAAAIAELSERCRDTGLLVNVLRQLKKDAPPSSSRVRFSDAV